MKPRHFALPLSLLLLAASARAATGWLCDPNANPKTLTEVGVEEGETPWVLSWVVSGGKFKIYGVVTEGSGGFLDFSLPVADADGTPRNIEVIGGDSLKGRSAIRRLRFSDTTTAIELRAFSDCAYLESVELPESLESIGNQAFLRCVRLRTVTPFLPDSVKLVDKSAFNGCTRLASPLSVGYGTSGGTPLAASLNDAAFAYCPAIPSASIGPGVTKIDSNLFVNDSSLRTVVLHDGVAAVNANAFSGCSSLETVTPFLPASVTSVGTGAFQNCYALKGDLFFATNGAAATIAGQAFQSDVAITSVTMGDGVPKINASTFHGCTSLTNARLSATLTAIDQSAFNGCRALETVEPFLPASVTSLGTYAFENCNALRGDLVFATNGAAATIASQAFQFDYGITSVTMGDGVPKINSSTFANCTSLTNARLSATLTSIEQSAFSGCTALENVEPFLPDTVASVGTYAFLNCRPLRNPLSVDGGGASVTVNAQAFYNCISIPTAFFGSNLTSQLNQQFCSRIEGAPLALREVSFGGKPTWSTSAFSALDAYQTRFVVPADNADWDAWLANASNATLWDDLTDAQRKLYSDAYPNEPPARALTKTVTGLQSQWVVSYGPSAAGAVDLVVAGDPAQAGAASVSPAYGTHADVASSLPLVLTAPPYADEPSGRYVCAGYRVEPAGDLGWGAATDFTLADPTAPSATFDPGTTGQFRFSWRWELAEFAVTFADLPDASIGTVSVSGQNARGFFDAGTTATVTAVPGAGVTFLRWLGDVPAGHETDATIQLAMDSSKMLTPVFSANWVFDANAKTLTDGYWTLQVTGSLDAISVSKPLVNSPLGLLDLAKPVEGGGTIVSIAANAFKENAALRGLTLPDTLRTIGTTVFYGCRALEGDVVVPDSVTSIGSQAFQYCSSLKAVRLGAGITSVPPQCFQYDSKLERVEMGHGVTSIGNYAFRDCSSLVSVSPLLPTATTSLGAGAFSGCGKLAGEVFFATNGAAASIGGTQAFYNCKTVSAATLGAGVTALPNETFSGCNALRRVRMGDGVTTIGQQAFNECKSLETVEPFLPGAVTSIGGKAFCNCVRLGGTFEIGTRKPAGAVTVSGDNTFYNASPEEIVVGRGVSALPKQFAMWNQSFPLSSLRTVRLDSVSSIGEKSFAACKAVKDVWFKGPAPTTYGSNVYQGWGAGQSVLHLPKFQPTWTDWAEANVTLWDDLTDDQRDLYRDRFPGRKVYGMTTSSATPASQFVVWWDAEAQPTVLIVK